MLLTTIKELHSSLFRGHFRATKYLQNVRMYWHRRCIGYTCHVSIRLYDVLTQLMRFRKPSIDITHNIKLKMQCFISSFGNYNPLAVKGFHPPSLSLPSMYKSFINM